MGLWVPCDSDLPQHPKSLKLARILEDPRAWTHVVELWLWAIKYAPDGDLSGYSDEEIARASGYANDPQRVTLIVDALKNCGPDNEPGFMDGNAHLHNWGPRVRKQLLTAARVRRFKMRHKRKLKGNAPALAERYPSVTTRPDLIRPDLDLTRSDQNPTPLPPAPEGGAVPSSPVGFGKFWTEYPPKRRVRKRVCLKLWRERKLEMKAEQIVAKLRVWKASVDWQKQDGKFIPAAPKFLKEWRWEDQPEGAGSESSYERTLRELE